MQHLVRHCFRALRGARQPQLHSADDPRSVGPPDCLLINRPTLADPIHGADCRAVLAAAYAMNGFSGGVAPGRATLSAALLDFLCKDGQPLQELLDTAGWPVGTPVDATLLQR